MPRGALPPLKPRRRVVVTGMGAVSCFGTSVEALWDAVRGGRSGGRPLAEAPYFVPNYVSDARRAQVLEALPCKVAHPVLTPPHLIVKGKDPFAATNSEPRYTRFAKFAAQAALEHSGLRIAKSAEERAEQPMAMPAQRIGVNVGIGMTPLMDVGEAAHVLYDPSSDGPKYNKISPYFVPKILANMVSGAISLDTGARGPNLSNVTACATGGHCIGDAARLIQLGHADAMICGATESAINAVGIAGFARMRALSSKRNDAPQTASRPFDNGRDGFVMGEGAGIFVLEELEAAERRGATIYAEVRGYGASGDAHHLTSPAPDGSGGLQALEAALADGGVAPEEVAYVNAHATSTPIGDGIELDALSRFFAHSANSRNSPVAVSSSKGSLGHLLGAAGAVEAIVAVLALHTGVFPPTADLEDPIPHDPRTIELLTAPVERKNVQAVASSSFGFGGTNSALVFTAV
jgi:3-oxoacyl-[acyl-carrier-protein] synthase II